MKEKKTRESLFGEDFFLLYKMHWMKLQLLQSHQQDLTWTVIELEYSYPFDSPILKLRIGFQE